MGLFAQGEMDAIRLSGGDLRGTARGQAMGGAFGALGGDVTGIMINPAGLGVYRSSEINVTMALNSANLKTDWQGITNKEGTTKFNFDNVSYVGYYPTGNVSVPVLNFAFSYNRLKNFNRRYSASAQGVGASLTDYIANITNGIARKDMEYEYRNDGTLIYDPYNTNIPWLSTLGWQGYLINDVTDNSYSGLLLSGETLSPRLQINEQGYIESYDFSLGTNFSDKLYLGLTVSLTDLFYHLNSSYGEEFQYGGNIALTNYFETTGTGFQFTFGGIWRPADFLRLGIAYHSPTWYRLEDYYQGWAYADYEGIKPGTEATPDDAWSRYRFNSPGNWVFSAAGIIGTKAVVSVDYELKDYTGMKLMNNEGNPYEQDNRYIKEDFRATSTLRAGLEYRFTSQFSGRVGYSYAQNPYENTFKDEKKEAMIIGTVPHYTIDGDVNYYTAGIGYRFTPDFYIDVALVYRTQQDKLYAFPSIVDRSGFIVESPAASIANNTCKGLVTVGYKF
ncbi:hemin receptor [Bacteroidia bacterium]|nr:hemin receptor [Bacteroidia bacterium]